MLGGAGFLPSTVLIGYHWILDTIYYLYILFLVRYNICYMIARWYHHDSCHCGE